MAAFSRVGFEGWEQGDDASAFARVTPDGWSQVAAAGGGGVTGTLSATLGALTLSGAGTLPIVGTLSQTLGTATLAATGTLPIVGTLNQSLDEVTLSATGVSGTTTTGTLDQTLAAATLSAVGALPIVGSASVTFDALTIAAAGTLPIVGTTSATLDALTLESTGTGASPIAGALDITLGDLVLSATGGEAVPAAQGGVPGRPARRQSFVVFIDGRRYIGTEEEVRALIEEFAEEQAERAILQSKPAKKPRIVVEPGRTVEGKVFKDMSPPPQVAQRAISMQTDMRRLYAEAVARMMAAMAELDEEESLIALL